VQQKIASEQEGTGQEGVSAVKMGVLLQQNQLYVLGCQIDTKSMCAERLNDILDEEITKIMRLTERHGALAAIALSKLLDMLEATHRLLIRFGLPIMPFPDLVSRALCTDTPNSVQSLLLVNVCEHLTSRALSNCFLLTHPHRLVPKKRVELDIRALCHGLVGDVLQSMLSPTAAFLTTENFRALFWHLDDGAVALLHGSLIGALSERLADFTERYASVCGRLIRIKDAPLATNCLQVYDRFEGAYRYFLDDQGVVELLSTMAEIGNVIAISEMMDDAFLLKRQSAAHASDFLLSRAPGQGPDEAGAEFFGMFDREFQDTRPYFAHLVPQPTEQDIVQPFLFSAIQEIARAVLASGRLFDETSANLFDLPSLTGFAARWSVLDFLYTLIEAAKVEGSDKPNEMGSIVRFGEGVHLMAAVILCITGQTPLYRAFSIGEKIASHFETDFSSGGKGARVRKYITVNKLVSSGYQCAVCVIQRMVDQIVRRK
jgi:hypothetical protein